MKLSLRHILRGITICLTFTLLTGTITAQWRADSLPGYEQRTLVMKPDYSGDVVATLVRHLTPQSTKRAVLYVHGYNDYFFQKALGDSIVRHGYSFYALDLRKYGRSILPHQDAFELRDITEYQEELSEALRIMREEGQTELFLLAHSTGGLITPLFLHDTKNRDGVRPK